MVRLGGFHVNRTEEIELDMVGCLFGLGVAGEGERGRLQVYFEGLRGDIGGRDCEGNEVPFGIAGGGALSPQNCLFVRSTLACLGFFACGVHGRVEGDGGVD